MSLQGIETLTPEVVDVTCDQLSSFLFAGHDTTSTLMSWAFYELSRTPHALRAVRSELDQLFGPDPNPQAVTARLLAPGGEELIHRMSYTMAVLKETLRLWPPGATTKITEPGTGFTISTPETGDLCVDGLMIYFINSIIQRDPKVFGESANKFVPERWLNDTDKIPRRINRDKANSHLGKVVSPCRKRNQHPCLDRRQLLPNTIPRTTLKRPPSASRDFIRVI